MLANTLRPTASLKDNLALAASLFFGAGGATLAKNLRDGTIPLPREWLLRQSRLRLDIMNIMYQRQLFVKWTSIRFILADSATINGRNFLCIREDSIRYPTSETLNAEFRKSYNLNAGFHTRLLPLSSSGAGHATCIKKTTNAANIYKMESEDMNQFDVIRSSVRGFASDQGAERGMGDETVTILPEYRGRYIATDPMNYLWPCCLFVMGHLHLLFNALEEACKGMGELSTKFFDALRSLCAFLNDSELRRQFQFDCCPDQQSASNSQTSYDSTSIGAGNFYARRLAVFSNVGISFAPIGTWRR